MSGQPGTPTDAWTPVPSPQGEPTADLLSTVFRTLTADQRRQLSALLRPPVSTPRAVKVEPVEPADGRGGPVGVLRTPNLSRGRVPGSSDTLDRGERHVTWQLGHQDSPALSQVFATPAVLPQAPPTWAESPTPYTRFWDKYRKPSSVISVGTPDPVALLFED